MSRLLLQPISGTPITPAVAHRRKPSDLEWRGVPLEMLSPGHLMECIVELDCNLRNTRLQRDEYEARWQAERQAARETEKHTCDCGRF